MMCKNQKTFNSNFYCTKCGNKGLPLIRMVSKARELGHLKKLYCYRCLEETNHVEIREMDSSYTVKDFNLEFRHGNFDKEGNRKLSFKLLKSSLKDKKNNDD